MVWPFLDLNMRPHEHEMSTKPFVLPNSSQSKLLHAHPRHLQWCSDEEWKFRKVVRTKKSGVGGGTGQECVSVSRVWRRWDGKDVREGGWDMRRGRAPSSWRSQESGEKVRTVDFQTQSSSASDHELRPALLHPLLRPDEECEYCSRVDHYLPSFL